MKALIVDDDRTVTTLLSRTLAKWEFEVSVAHDGEAAWDVTRIQLPQMAIVDWMMPVLDGLSLCRRIRQDAATAHMYLILLTTRGCRADVIEGLDAGADDYLVKPCDPGELRARLRVGERVLMLQERLSERVVELEAAAMTVKQLQGLIPICSYCKRIRSHGDDWEQLESYISGRTDAHFTHGVCPTCLAAAAADLMKP